MLGLAALWFVFLFCALAAQASTISGNIRNTSGNAYATNALFTPLSTPQADGANIIASTPTNVIAATDGSFSVILKQGNYKVNIGNVPNDTFVISVPNYAVWYNRIRTLAGSFDYTWSGLYDRTHLINQTLSTVLHNLVAGGALVIVVLLAMLGNLRGTASREA